MNEVPKKFYGQFDPPLDQVLYERYFKTLVGPGTFIECGAFDGLTESSCLFFEETLGWRGINIEPLPYAFDLLQKNRPLSTNLNIALSSEDSIKRFRNAIHPTLGQNFGNGSISHTLAHTKLLMETGCSFEEFNVKTRTLRSVIGEMRVTELDLMVLDVEGHELDVIRGMINCDVLPRVLVVEFGHIGLEHLADILERVGFSLDLVSFANSIWLRTAPNSLDVIFEG